MIFLIFYFILILIIQECLCNPARSYIYIKKVNIIMNINNLKYFTTVADLGNLTVAAEKLFVSQPALSKTIHNLESTIGYELFDRVGKNIILNEKGKIFYRYAMKILNALEDAQKELHDLDSVNASTVRIQLSAAAQYFVQLLASFQHSNPEIHFQLIDPVMMTSYNIQPELVIFSSDADIKSENSETLYTEDFMLAVPVSHPLAAYSSVSIKDIYKENFLTLSSGISLRKTLDRYFDEHSLSPAISYETGNFSLLKSMVANGLGISIVPAFSWKDITSQGFCKLVPIQDISFQRHVHIKWDDERYLSKACRKTLDYLFQYNYQDRSSTDF